MSRDMASNLLAIYGQGLGTYGQGTPKLGAPEGIIVTDSGPHRLIGTTPVPALPSTAGRTSEKSFGPSNSPVELSEWQHFIEHSVP